MTLLRDKHNETTSAPMARPTTSLPMASFETAIDALSKGQSPYIVHSALTAYLTKSSIVGYTADNEDIFGSEVAAEFFMSGIVYGGFRGLVEPNPAPELIFLELVRRNEPESWLAVSAQGKLLMHWGVNRWLEWRAPDGQMYGAAIPVGMTDSCVVDAIFDRQRFPQTFAVSVERGKEIDLMYRTYRSLDATLVAQTLAAEVPLPESPAPSSYAYLRQSLHDKTTDPLGSLEAALILLRSRAFGILYGDPLGSPPLAMAPNDWLSNLAEWYPAIGPDAAALVLQRFVSDPAGARANLQRVQSIVTRLAMDPLPVTDEALRYLLGLCRLASEPNAAAVDHVSQIINELRNLPERFPMFELAECLVETDGLFAIFRGPSNSYTQVRDRYLKRM